MKSRPASAPWLRGAIVTAVVLFGLWIAWVVFLGPAVLILMSPR